MRVVIVGAGVIGASIAWHLSRMGAAVTLVDAGFPAASATSFGWINASFYKDAAHHRLRAAGLSSYHRLVQAVPDLPINFCGALWWEAQGADLRALQNALEELKYPVAALDAPELRDIEPQIKDLPSEALRFDGEGCADVAALASALVRASGARLVSGVQVTGIATSAGAVTGVTTTLGAIDADRVIVAAGNGAPDVLASVNVALPMLKRPGVLVTTAPIRGRIRSILVTPHGEIRQLPDGRLLASAVANHQGDDASEVTDTPQVIADRVMAWIRPLIGQNDVSWEAVRLAYRPVPKDGLPVIGAVGPDGLHVAVMHSGATLAAIVGEAVAAEALGQGGYDDLLAPYRSVRFQ